MFKAMRLAIVTFFTTITNLITKGGMATDNLMDTLVIITDEAKVTATNWQQDNREERALERANRAALIEHQS